MGNAYGIKWDPIIISEKDYEDIKIALLNFDKEAHPVCPDCPTEFRIDEELERFCESLEAWERAFTLKYIGLQEGKQFRISKKKYSFLLDGSLIGQVQVLHYRKPSQWTGKLQLYEGIDQKAFESLLIFLRGPTDSKKVWHTVEDIRRFGIIDYWGDSQNFIKLALTLNYDVAFVPTFTSSSPTFPKD
jgi:hypothetical protein